MSDRLRPSLIGDPNMLLAIDFIGISSGSVKALKMQGVFFVGHLLTCTQTDLLKMPNLGRKQIIEIGEVLANHGYLVGEGEEYEKSFDGILLREVFDISEDIPKPTEWQVRPDRPPVENPLKKWQPVKHFSAILNVDILHPAQNDDEMAKVKGLCQKAFEIAVLNASRNAIHSTQPVPLDDALKAELKFDKDAHQSMQDNIMQGYIFTTEVALSVEATAAFGPTLLRRVAKSIDGSVLTGYVAAVLKSAQEPQ